MTLYTANVKIFRQVFVAMWYCIVQVEQPPRLLLVSFGDKVYILLFDSCVKFHANICTNCWISTKVAGGTFYMFTVYIFAPTCTEDRGVRQLDYGPPKNLFGLARNVIDAFSKCPSFWTFLASACKSEIFTNFVTLTVTFRTCMFVAIRGRRCSCWRSPLTAEILTHHLKNLAWRPCAQIVCTSCTTRGYGHVHFYTRRQGLHAICVQLCWVKSSNAESPQMNWSHLQLL